MRRKIYFVRQNWFGIILSVILIATLVCFIISWKLDVKKYCWCSNAMLSVAGGLVSGFILYFLTNIRNVKNNRIVDYYSRLKKTMGLLTDIRSDAKYYKDNEDIWGEETGLSLRCEKIINRLEVFQDEIFELPDCLFIQFTGGFENELTDNVIDDIKNLYDEIEDFDDLSQYVEIYKNIVDYLNEAENLIKPTFEKYRKLYKNSIKSIL